MIDAFCIANKRAELLFFTSFNASLDKGIFGSFLNELTACAFGDPPPTVDRDGLHFVYIFRDELYWACIVALGTITSKCGDLFVVDCLNDFHHACAALCGTVTQYTITANATLLQEIVMETMCGGCFQMQEPEKLQTYLYSSIVTPKETSALSLTPGLFGLEKSAPSHAAQQSLLTVDKSKREVFIDVVERVCARVGKDGILIRAEVHGCVTLHYFLPESPSLILKFNTDLNTVPSEGFTPSVQVAEAEFGSGVDTSDLTKDYEVHISPAHGESTILSYSLPPSLPHLLPFTVSAVTQALTPSDAELHVKLNSTTGMGTVAPHVILQFVAPLTTATVMSRCTGPRNQVVYFSQSDKTIRWTISDFPGGSQAQAFIRLVDAGGDAKVENAQLEFEVSKWVSSGLHIESIRLHPPIPKVSKWVRYLTVSDSISLCFT